MGFSRPLCEIPVLFKAYLTFKDFSRKLSKFKYFSSLSEPWRIGEKKDYSYLFSNECRKIRSAAGHLTLQIVTQTFPVVNKGSKLRSKRLDIDQVNW